MRGHGRERSKSVYRGREYDLSLLPKTMIEMAVPDELATMSSPSCKRPHRRQRDGRSGSEFEEG